MQAKERHFNISLLRVLSTFLIIAFHTLLMISPYSGKTFFPFYIGVPCFLFISGYLYSNKKIDNIKSFYKKSILKIIIPTIIFFVLYFIVIGIISLVKNTSIVLLLQSKSVTGATSNSLGHLWFVYAIIFCYLILPLLQLMHDKKLEKIINIIIICLLVIIEVAHIIPGGQPFITPFIAGFLLAKKDRSNNKIIFIISLIAFALLTASYPFVYKFYLQTPYLQLHFIKEIIVTLMGIFFSTSFLYITRNVKLNSFIKKPINFLDKISFPIFFIHHILIIGALSLLNLTPYVTLNIIIFLATTIIISTLFNYFVNLITKKERKNEN